DAPLRLRHRRVAELQNALAALEPFLKGVLPDREAHHAVCYQRLDLPLTEVATLRANAEYLAERHADAAKLGGKIKQLAELAVPAHELHVLVEHAETMPNLIEGGLQ